LINVQYNILKLRILKDNARDIYNQLSILHTECNISSITIGKGLANKYTFILHRHCRNGNVTLICHFYLPLFRFPSCFFESQPLAVLVELLYIATAACVDDRSFCKMPGSLCNSKYRQSKWIFSSVATIINASTIEVDVSE
jgi:hypothetical protein